MQYLAKRGLIQLPTDEGVVCVECRCWPGSNDSTRNTHNTHLSKIKELVPAVAGFTVPVRGFSFVVYTEKGKQFKLHPRSDGTCNVNHMTDIHEASFCFHAGTASGRASDGPGSFRARLEAQKFRGQPRLSSRAPIERDI